MKNLKLMQLSIKNFKGVKDLKVNLSGPSTRIKGANATGKTTINDAFNWVMFDKDSQGRGVFEIKPLAADGTPVNFLDTVVEAEIMLDSKIIKLSKTYREKWVKSKGEAEKSLVGHETIYYIDEVPVKKADYTKFIQAIQDEKIFKALSGPGVFEGQKWQDKRAILFDICGNIGDADIIASDKKLSSLAAILGDKTLEDIKKSINATKKKLKADIENIPPRIDELSSNLKDYDVEALQQQLEALQTVIRVLDGQLEANDEIYAKRRNLQNVISNYMQDRDKLLQQIKDFEANIGRDKRQKISQLDYLLDQYKDDIERTTKNILSNKKEIVDNEALIVEYRKDYAAIQAELFDNNFDCMCPTCKQLLPGNMISDKGAALKANFERDKANKLLKILENANRKKAAISILAAKLKEQEADIERLNENIAINIDTKNDVEKQLQQPADNNIIVTINKDIDKINTEIQALEMQLELLKVEADLVEVKKEKGVAGQQIDSIKANLTRAEAQKGINNRIEELEQQFKDLNIQLADIEKQEFLVEEFNRKKIDMLEQRINSKFKYVTFKLFNEQVNGGIAECCESLINGVPYSNANNAAQINAGIDIINTLAGYYEFSAPIFIDNAEGVNELAATQAQVIALEVTTDKELVIE